MHLRKVILTALTLMLTTIVMVIDTQIAQANGFIAWLCRQYPNLCSDPGGGTGPRWYPAEIDRIETRIRQGQGKALDYLVVGYLQEQQKNYRQASVNYLRGLQLATNIQEQAIGHDRLAEVYAATGKREAALTNLKQAEILYETLGETRRVREIRQRQINLPRR